jgi:hypothetical protein
MYGGGSKSVMLLKLFLIFDVRETFEIAFLPLCGTSIGRIPFTSKQYFFFFCNFFFNFQLSFPCGRPHIACFWHFGMKQKKNHLSDETKNQK